MEVEVEVEEYNEGSTFNKEVRSEDHNIMGDDTVLSKRDGEDGILDI